MCDPEETIKRIHNCAAQHLKNKTLPEGCRQTATVIGRYAIPLPPMNMIYDCLCEQRLSGYNYRINYVLGNLEPPEIVILHAWS